MSWRLDVDVLDLGEKIIGNLQIRETLSSSHIHFTLCVIFSPLNGHAFLCVIRLVLWDYYAQLLHAKSLTLHRNHQQRVWTFSRRGDSLSPSLYSSRGLNEHAKILLTTLTTCRKRWEMDWMRWTVKSSSLDAFIDFLFSIQPTNIQLKWLLTPLVRQSHFHELFEGINRKSSFN